MAVTETVSVAPQSAEEMPFGPTITSAVVPVMGAVVDPEDEAIAKSVVSPAIVQVVVVPSPPAAEVELTTVPGGAPQAKFVTGEGGLKVTGPNTGAILIVRVPLAVWVIVAAACASPARSPSAKKHPKTARNAAPRRAISTTR